MLQKITVVCFVGLLLSLQLCRAFLQRNGNRLSATYRVKALYLGKGAANPFSSIWYDFQQNFGGKAPSKIEQINEAKIALQSLTQKVQPNGVYATRAQRTEISQAVIALEALNPTVSILICLAIFSLAEDLVLCLTKLQNRKILRCHQKWLDFGGFCIPISTHQLLVLVN